MFSSFFKIAFFFLISFFTKKMKSTRLGVLPAQGVKVMDLEILLPQIKPHYELPPKL